MADRCFQAGRELYAQIGTYCFDTRKVARFSLEEMDAAAATAPASIEYGLGNDAVEIRHREVGGDTPVFVLGGLQTLLFSDRKTELAVYRACCRCPDVHGIVGGTVTELDGQIQMMADTPLEILPYRHSAEALREAAAQVGRPGMTVTNGAPKAVAHISMYAGEDGLRPSDGIQTGGVPELKTSFDRLQRVGFGLATSTHISAGLGCIIGGFSGSVEGAAIVAAAGVYQSLLVNKGQLVLITATPIQTQSRATRSGIWASSLALQAVGRNTQLVLAGANGDHPAAGPGTVQYFYETAAGAVSGVVCGGHSLGGTRKFTTGPTRDYGSPVESEFLGRVCRAAVGMEPAEANRVVKHLLSRYEDKLKTAPSGRTLHELYDLASETPRAEYRTVYNAVAAELRELGVPMKDYTPCN